MLLTSFRVIALSAFLLDVRGFLPSLSLKQNLSNNMAFKDTI